MYLYRLKNPQAEYDEPCEAIVAARNSSEARAILAQQQGDSVWERRPYRTSCKKVAIPRAPRVLLCDILRG